MAWVKLSDQYGDEWQLAAVSTDAECVFLRLLACSNRALADGLLDDAVVRQQVRARLPESVAAEAAMNDLVRVGLLQSAERGGRPHWQIANPFIGWQPRREQVEAERKRWREDQLRHRQATAEAASRRKRRRREIA